MFHHFAFELKLVIVSLLGAIALVADGLADFKNWEDFGLKTILGAAVLYIGRIFLQQQKDHKAELLSLWQEHKAESLSRESAGKAALDANTKALCDLTVLTKEQTDYFKTVTRTIVDERLAKSKLP